MTAKIDVALSYQSTPEYAELLRRSSESIYPIAAPYQLSIGVWGHCNSPCGYCLNWTGKNPAPTTDQIKVIFNEAKDLGVKQILFSGGEPTLRPDLIEVMGAAKKLGFDVLLITNGLRLDHEYIQKLGAIGCKKIGLSLDSLDPVRYRSIRGVPLDRAHKALDLLAEAVHQQPTEYHVSVCVTVSRKNIIDLLPMMEECRIRKLAVQYQPVNFDETTSQDMRQAFWPNSNEIQQIKEIMDVLISKKKQGAAISNRLEFLAAIPEYFENGTFHPRQCYTPYAQIVIDQYMNLNPCWAMDSVGKVGKDGSLKDLWFSSEMREVRKIVRENKCPGCTYSCHLSKEYIQY